MVSFLNWLPSGYAIFGREQRSPRDDIDDPLDLPVIVHRNVSLEAGVHIYSLKCPCCPTWRTKGEVDSSAFKYEISTLNGGFH